VSRKTPRDAAHRPAPTRWVSPVELTPEFLADLTHDLRSPLNGIVGFAALLHEGKLGPLSTDQADCLADILTSAQELVRLVDEVSDLGKVESGTLTLRPEHVDLVSLIDDVQASLAELSASKRVQVIRTVDPALAGVVADSARLKQVLTTCATHAVKATPEGGRVTIRATAQDPAHFRIEVEDSSGRPKDPEQLASLGFVLSRRLVELQGGELGVRSTPGHGGVFVAVLPRRLEARSAG
jgi:signal transduction histidine kinase